MAVVASQLVAKVSVEGADATKRTLGEVGQATTQAGEKAKGAQSVFGDFLKSQIVMSALSTSFSFLKDQIGSMFQESMDGAVGMAQTVSVLKSTHDASGETAQGIADLATKMSHLTLFSDDTVQSAENMILTFTDIGKSVFPQATKTVLDMSQALGQDTKSSAIQLGKALNDPIQGITALSRVGVTFTQSQKDAIKAMVDAGNTAGAQKIILAELQREFGGSAEAAGKTFPGQLQILSQSFDDIKQKIGDALMPALQNMTGWVTANAVPAFDRFSDWFTKTGLPAIQHFATIIQQNATPILAGLAAIVIGAVVPAFWAWAAAMIANPIGLIITGIALAIGGLVAGFTLLYQHNAGFRGFIDGIVNGFKQAAGFIQANFLPALKMVGDLIGTYVMPFLAQLGSFIATQFQPVWQQLVSLWNSQLSPLLAQLWQGLQKLVPLFQLIGIIVATVVVVALGLLSGVLTGVAKGISYMVEGLANVVTGVVRMFTGLIQIMSGTVQFIVDLFTGHFDKLGADLGQIWQGIINVFTGALQAIGGVFQAAWGFISGMVGGFVQGIIAFFTTLWDKLVGHSIIPDMWKAIVGFFTSEPQKIMYNIGAFISNLLNNFGGLKDKGVAVFQSMISQIGSIFGKLGGLASGAFNGALDAVKQGINWVIGAINGFIDNIDKISINVPGIGHVGFSIPDIPYLASGGSLASGGLVVTGERGPELSYMPAGARVFSNNQSSDILSALSQVQGGAGAGQPIILQVDGRTFARLFMPHMVNEIRNSVGVRF